MKLFNIFKKNKKRFVTGELISLNALAKVPDIDYFKNNNQFLLLINLRKKEYLETLIEEKVLTSSELKSEELQDKLNMLHNLIEQNTLGNDLFDKVIFDEQDKVKALISLRKFIIYSEQIKELEEEVVSRIIALKEILNRTFLNKQKRISIINEVNRLTNVFVVLMNQKETLNLCLSNYGKKCFDITKERDLEKEERLLNKRKEELNKYQEQTFGKINIEINNLNDMAKVEVALEEYIFLNKDKINEEIANFNEASLLDEGLDNLKNVITKFNLYYELGKNVIPVDYIKRLYQIKFRLLTMDTVGCIEPFINDQTRELELAVYKEIIMQKINDLLKGDNKYLKETFKKDYSKALLEITKQLKGKNKYYPEVILKSRYQLNLLLATDVASGIPLFFANYKIYTTDDIYAIDYATLQMYNVIFDWEEEIYLETLCRLWKINKSKNRSLLYDLYVKNNPIFKENYYLYSGVKNVKKVNFFKDFFDITNKNDMSHSLDIATENILKTIKKEAIGKNVIMPNSLKKYDFNLFKDTLIKGIIFPEGFTELGNKVLANNKLTYVSLPSTLTTISGNVFEYGQIINTIVFTNFQNSNILWNKNLLHNLLKGLIDSDVIRETNNGYIFKNHLRFDQIILLDGDKKIKILSNELECEYKALNDNYDVTIEKIQKLVKEKIETQNVKEKLILSKKFNYVKINTTKKGFGYEII